MDVAQSVGGPHPLPRFPPFFPPSFPSTLAIVRLALGRSRDLHITRPDDGNREGSGD